MSEVITTPPTPVKDGPDDKTDNKTATTRRFLNGWTKEQETLMANWGDLAVCYRFLHDKSHKIYRRKALWISSSVIILSSVGGFANIGVQSLFRDDEKAKELASFAIGGLSLFAGMLTTLNNLLKFSQLEESHRVSAIAWSKFGRLIMVELALHPNDRMDSLDFLKICRAELDRLIEQSPTIPQSVINDFEKRFGSIKDLKKPEVCGNLEHTQAFESSQTRLKQVATEAALMLRKKKETLKELVTPEMESRIAAQVNERLEAAIEERKKRLEEEIEIKKKDEEDKKQLAEVLIQQRRDDITKEIELAKKRIEDELEAEKKRRQETEETLQILSEERKKRIEEEIELEKHKLETQQQQHQQQQNINTTDTGAKAPSISAFESRLNMNRRSVSLPRTTSIRRRSHIEDGQYTLETKHNSKEGVIKVADMGSIVGIQDNEEYKNNIILVNKD